MERLDGNALAGALGEVFAREPTAARACCAACGTVLALGEEAAWTGGPGAVLRCAGCESVLLVLVRTEQAWRLGLDRLRWLELAD